MIMDIYINVSWVGHDVILFHIVYHAHIPLRVIQCTSYNRLIDSSWSPDDVNKIYSFLSSCNMGVEWGAECHMWVRGYGYIKARFTSKLGLLLITWKA